MTKDSEKGLLYKFEYPPCKLLVNDRDNTIISCGGGGSSKTGIPNYIELHEFPPQVDDNEKTPFKVNSIAKLNTDPIAIMSMDRHYNFIVCAEGNKLREYILINEAEFKPIEEYPKHPKTVLRDRRKSESEQVQEDDEVDGEPDVTQTGEQSVRLCLHREVDCVFKENKAQEEHQKAAGVEVSCVRYGGRYGEIVVAAGSTGAVRVYRRFCDDQPTQLTLQRKLNSVVCPNVGAGKTVGVCDMDVSPAGDEFVTVCENPDGRLARVWNINAGTKVTELAITVPQHRYKISIKGQYRFKHVRYLGGRDAPLTVGGNPFLLVATHQPNIVDPRRPSFLSVWSGPDYSPVELVSLGRNRSPGSRSHFVATALAVQYTARLDPHCALIGLGSGDGQVDVYSLKLSPVRVSAAPLYSLPCSHSFFVTDLIFLPSPSGLNSCPQLVSAGVDRMLRHHRCPPISTSSACHHVRIRRLAWGLLIMLLIDRIFIWLFLL